MYVAVAILDYVDVIVLVIPVFFRQVVSADLTPACVNLLPFVDKNSFLSISGSNKPILERTTERLREPFLLGFQRILRQVLFSPSCDCK